MKHMLNLLIILVAAESMYLWSITSVPTEYTIRLGEEGFYPKKLSIKRFDRVRFMTDRGKEFWPASDLHPSHEMYPAFDPKKPISAHQSWSFIFEKSGTWRYHDHVAPLFRGTIHVK